MAATKIVVGVGRSGNGKREAAPPWTANPVLALERELGRKITTAELVEELERRRGHLGRGRSQVASTA